jgi:amino acid transporter
MKNEGAIRPQQLNRQIGPVPMLLTAITSMIGSGWLFASLYAAQIAGPAAVLSWLIGGAVAVTLALVYAELGAMLPVAGALARIPIFSHGQLSGFMAGWLCWIAYVATAPIEVVAVLDYATNYWPWLTMSEHGERVLTPHGLVVAIVMMFIFTLINMLGVKWLAHTSSAISIWKLAVPLAAALALIWVGFQPENFHAAGGFAPNGVSGIFAAVSGGGVLFSLFGFRTVIDMAGEARRPQRTVPLAIIGGVVICLLVYILLQIAFIGVIPADHLAAGWKQIEENVPGGPFAAFAALLGLQWLALTLYADAIISPGGTGLAFIGATARINYAMAQNRQFPRAFTRLNRFRVPIWSLLFNFVVGMILFLPFPGWAELVGFISSAAILSFAFGPVSLAALRYQVGDLERPYRVPAGLAFSATTFVLVGFVVYWTGWHTNWKVFLLALAGLILLGASRLGGKDPAGSLQFRHSAWFFPYLAGMALISWLGNYGGGLQILGHGLDIALIVILSLWIFRLALRQRLPAAETERLVSEVR